MILSRNTVEVDNVFVELLHSELENKDISDTNYDYCEQIGRYHDMKTFRDFMIWYNNRDVVPFFEAIEKQLLFYKLRHIDMFKDVRD